MKCAYCEKETKNPKYCSLSCQVTHRNKVVREKNIEKYNSKPSKCKNCDVVLAYDDRNNSFCSNSCSALFNNSKRILSEKAKENIKQSMLKRLKKEGKIIYPYTPVKFYICEITGKPYCNKNEKGYVRKASPYTKTEKQIYYEKAAFKFNVYDYPEHFDLKLLEERGWYTCPGKKRKNSKKNVDGVSRDHLVSISEGFKMGYPPEDLAHPANCRLVLHSENKRKAGSSLISYEDLIKRKDLFHNLDNNLQMKGQKENWLLLN